MNTADKQWFTDALDRWLAERIRQEALVTAYRKSLNDVKEKR